MVADVDMVGSLHRESEESVYKRIYLPKKIVPNPDKALEN